MLDRDAVFSEWEASGFTGALCHLYTSDWNESDKVIFQAIVNVLNFPALILLRSHDKEIIFNSHIWKAKYRESWCLVNIPIQRFLLGQYIEISIPFGSENREAARTQHTTVTALLRLVSQPGIARELVAETDVSFPEMQKVWSPAGSTGRAVTVERQGSWLSSDGILQQYGSEPDTHITWKAAHFIDLALQQEDESIKFIILWSALESLLGDGHKRRDYFKNNFGDEVSTAVKKLHDLRNSIVHYEGFGEKITRSVISLMLEVIRAASLRGDEVRKIISERLKPVCKQFNEGTLPETLDTHSTSHVIVPLSSKANP